MKGSIRSRDPRGWILAKSAFLRGFMAVALVAVLLSVGAFAVQYLTPSGEGSIVDAILSRENAAATFPPLMLHPSSQAHIVLEMIDCRLISPNNGGGTSLDPDGTYVDESRCLPSNQLSNSVPTSFTTYYAVFSYKPVLVSGGAGISPDVWFTSPNGNATALAQRAYFGLLGLSGSLVILEAPLPGNYSIHFLNRNVQGGSIASTWNGTFSMGQSNVVFSRPYVTAGFAIITVAIVCSAVLAYTSLG